MILPKEKYQKTVKRPYPPLLGSLVLQGITDTKVYDGFFSVPFARKDSILCDGAWYNNGEAEDYGRELISKEWNNQSSIDFLSKECRHREKILLDSADKSFEVYSKAFENYMVALTLVYLAEAPFFNKLKEMLMENSDEMQAKELLEILNTPFEDNYHRKEEYDLITSNNLTEHVKKYEWFLSRNGADVIYTVDKAKERLLSLDKDFLSKYNILKEEVKTAIEKAKNIVGQQNRYLVDGLQFIVFYRTHRTDVISRSIFMHKKVLNDIAKANSLLYEDILFCLEAELIKKSIPSVDTIQERKKGYVIYSENGHIICKIGKEFEDIRRGLEDDIQTVTELRGNSASKGKSVGKVKIINNSLDFSKINDGDILVSSMTTPEMVPIMKKSSAFITDEGGITCHAAIVARELKKPCIIGTKIATKVLKDGDMVEVDADKGIVNIIK